MHTINDTTQSKTIDVVNTHEDSLYTAINSQEEITSALLFPTVGNTSRQDSKKPKLPQTTHTTAETRVQSMTNTYTEQQ